MDNETLGYLSNKNAKLVMWRISIQLFFANSEYIHAAWNEQSRWRPKTGSYPSAVPPQYTPCNDILFSAVVYFFFFTFISVLLLKDIVTILVCRWYLLVNFKLFFPSTVRKSLPEDTLFEITRQLNSPSSYRVNIFLFNLFKSFA